MSWCTFHSDMTVTYVDHMGSDQRILDAMLVSTDQHNTQLGDMAQQVGRLNFLMKNRHGSPFEHGAITFYVEAPIFVFREWHRHRIGFSYNEMSGRYTQLEPIFYLPNEDRNLTQVGKPGAYEMRPGTPEQQDIVSQQMRSNSIQTWLRYQRLLNSGISNEVARMVLPLNTYTKMYVTLNPRSIMSFLSLRTDNPASTYPSKPMREIAMCAEQMETTFSDLFPLTHRVYHLNGRVSP